jgi:hypothetical protein
LSTERYVFYRATQASTLDDGRNIEMPMGLYSRGTGVALSGHLVSQSLCQRARVITDSAESVFRNALKPFFDSLDLHAAAREKVGGGTLP